MLLKRRDKPPFWPRLREVFFPRKGWKRPFHYAARRLRRLPDSPHAIGVGFFCGTLLSFSPFMGFHMILSLALAWAVRGNLLAAALANIWGNLITFPLVVAFCLELGRIILGSPALPIPDHISFAWVFDNLGAVFWPWLVGGTIAGTVCGTVCYWLIVPAVAAYRAARIERLRARAEAVARRRSGQDG